MKKIFYFIFASISVFYSCSGSDDTDGKLVKKIIEIKADETSSTTVFTYNGREIVSIDGDQKHTDFTYTGDLITKIETLNKTNEIHKTVEYIYVEEKLTCAKSPNNYRINYIHNSDGSISYEKLAIDSGIQEVRLFHGILYFQNGNFIRDERILDNTEVGVLSKYIISFEYDSKNNPLNNIKGHNKLLDHNETISLNNSVRSTVIFSVVKEDQATSSANFYKSYFKYDSSGYPTEQVSETSVSNNGDFLKSLYFYE